MSANAFADHFLSDLFAAGHYRTPRRALFEAKNMKKMKMAEGLSGLLALCMHRRGQWRRPVREQLEDRLAVEGLRRPEHP
jgi:hypothetical protein